MSKWLSPQKMLDYHIVRRFGDVAEAERQLYLAVVRGDVRARLNGKDTRAGVAQAALPDENLGSLLVRAAARYRIGSGGRTASLAGAAHGRSLCESRRAMLRALDRETYRRLSVNSLDACP